MKDKPWLPKFKDEYEMCKHLVEAPESEMCNQCRCFYPPFVKSEHWRNDFECVVRKHVRRRGENKGILVIGCPLGHERSEIKKEATKLFYEILDPQEKLKHLEKLK
jgi:hypothetical protein